MKSKLITSTYDKETGISFAEIVTPLGKFTGVCKLHPEDQEYGSRFLGCDFAERRAYIKALKAKRKAVSAEIKTLEDLYKRLSCYKDFNPDSFEAKKIRKTIYEKKTSVESFKNLISAYEEALNKSFEAAIEKKKKFLEKIEDKRG